MQAIRASEERVGDGIASDIVVEAAQQAEHARLQFRRRGEFLFGPARCELQLIVNGDQSPIGGAWIPSLKKAPNKLVALPGLRGREHGAVALASDSPCVRPEESEGQHDTNSRNGDSETIASKVFGQPIARRGTAHGDGATLSVSQHVVSQRFRRPITGIGAFVQRVENDRVEIAAQRGVVGHCRRWRWLGVADETPCLLQIAAFDPIGEGLGQQFVQQESKLIDIARGRDRFAVELFGRCVLWCVRSTPTGQRS